MVHNTCTASAFAMPHLCGLLALKFTGFTVTLTGFNHIPHISHCIPHPLKCLCIKGKQGKK